MDPQTKDLLNKTFELVEDNNQMLHKIRSGQKWATFWHIVKMLVIVGITLGSLYYIQPYLNKVLDLYNSISGTEQKLNKLGNSTDSISNILKKLGN